MFHLGYHISLTHLCFIAFLSMYIVLIDSCTAARVFNKLTTYLLTFPAISRRRHSVLVCLSVRSWLYILPTVNKISDKWLSKFHQIYNLGAVGNEDELIRFWGSKGQGHGETKYGPKRRSSSGSRGRVSSHGDWGSPRRSPLKLKAFWRSLFSV